MSFTQKLINIQVQLAQKTGQTQPGKFDESGTDTVTLSGNRVSVRIESSGSMVEHRASVRIYGLTESLMNQMSTLGIAFNVLSMNTATITVGDINGMSVVFQGVIWQAYADYNAAPDVPLILECIFVGPAGLSNTTPTSYTGPTLISTVMQSFATTMGFGFQNNGVSGAFQSGGGAGPYFSGSVWQQMNDAVEHANIAVAFQPGSPPTMIIAPKGSAASNPGGIIPIIAPPPNGEMIGYPLFNNNGIIVETLYSPNITLLGLVNVQSSILADVQATFPQANFPSTGNWAVYKMDHALDSLNPNGHWKSTLYCWNAEYGKPPPVLLS